MTDILNNITRYQFFIPGDPVAKGRPRLSRFGTYTPKKTKDYEKLIQSIARKEYLGPVIEGMIFVHLEVRRPIPSSLSKKKRNLAITGALRPIARPDNDNYEKAIWDALNGICWVDDSQIVTNSCRKIFSENPGVMVTIEVPSSAYSSK